MTASRLTTILVNSHLRKASKRSLLQVGYFVLVWFAVEGLAMKRYQTTNCMKAAVRGFIKLCDVKKCLTETLREKQKIKEGGIRARRLREGYLCRFE